MNTPAVNCNNKHSLESLIKLLIRDADCEPYVECNTREGYEALVKQLFSVLDDGTLALNVCECDVPEPPVELPFRMLIDTQGHADTMIGGDSSDVAAWNAFFDLPTNGTPFDNIALTNVVGGVQVDLFGGANIKLRDYVFGDNDPSGTSLLEVDDQLECVIECGIMVFSDDHGGEGCHALTKVYLPVCTILGREVFAYADALVDLLLPFESYTTIGDSLFTYASSLQTITFPNVLTVESYAFSGMSALTTIDLSSCTDLGGTTGDNHVFDSITGNTITITIPHALETDGDIVYLVANNTVTIIYSD